VGMTLNKAGATPNPNMINEPEKIMIPQYKIAEGNMNRVSGCLKNDCKSSLNDCMFMSTIYPILQLHISKGFNNENINHASLSLFNDHAWTGKTNTHLCIRSFMRLVLWIFSRDTKSV
jgi:hypothetical protein